MKFIFMLLGLGIMVERSEARQCSAVVRGRVLDATSGLAIPDVYVVIREQGKGARSNEKGDFQIEGLCEGSFTLIAKHLNHEEKAEKIVIAENEVTKNIYLLCHTDTLHNITVKGARLNCEDIAVIHKIQERDLFMSSGQSLGKALEKVNGVYNLSTGNHISKPIIRGMHSNRVLIMNNEIRQEGQQWGNEHAPEIDAFVAQSIEVVKGAQSIRYSSDVMGGVILVKPAPLKEIKGVRAEINTAAMSNGRSLATSVMLEGKRPAWQGLAWRLQGTFKQAGNSKTPGYYLNNTGMKEFNYSGAAGYARKNLNVEIFHSRFQSDLAIFAGSHIGNLSDLYQAFYASRPLDSSGFSYKIDMPFQRVDHSLSKANLSYKIRGIGLMKFVYAYQQNIRKEFDRNIVALNPDGSYKPSLHFVLKTHQYDFSFEHQLFKKWNGMFGVNGLGQSNEYYGAYFIPNYQKNSGGVYLIEKWNKNRFSFEGGLRYDINQFAIKKWEQNVLLQKSHHFEGIAASAVFRYQLPYCTMHAHLGTTWRAPFVNELYSYGVHHSAASFEMGDRNLTSERSYNSALTFDFNYKNSVDAEFTVYHNYIRNFINLQPVLPAVLTIRGAFPAFAYSQTNVNMSGLEFSASKKISRFALAYLKANLLLARDLLNQKYLYGMPPGRLESDLDIALYQRGEQKLNWLVGASYTAKQNRYREEDDYVPVPAAYFLLHSDLIAQFRLASQFIRINLGIQNILNTSYRDYLDRTRYFANQAGRNIYFRLSVPIEIKK